MTVLPSVYSVTWSCLSGLCLGVYKPVYYKLFRRFWYIALSCQRNSLSRLLWPIGVLSLLQLENNVAYVFNRLSVKYWILILDFGILRIFFSPPFEVLQPKLLRRDLSCDYCVLSSIFMYFTWWCSGCWWHLPSFVNGLTFPLDGIHSFIKV